MIADRAVAPQAKKKKTPATKPALLGRVSISHVE
jgi:hypothetical protein